jgi:hypothetical protein
MQFLTVLINSSEFGRLKTNDFRAMLWRLKNPTVITPSLKELTIGIRFHQYDGERALALGMLSCLIKQWKNIDLFLSSLPSMRKILIMVGFPIADVTSSEVQLALQSCFPVLGERGIVCFESCSISELEKYSW